MPDPVNEVERLLASGEELATAGRWHEARAAFRTAWDILPDPKEKQEAAIGILAAVADCCFFLGTWNDCVIAVQNAFQCGGDVSNPFFRLRLGQSLYELGNFFEAANWLAPVYLAEGRKPFENEDPKYLEFFRSELNPPPGGWPEGW
jgi:tetratricopeptide (TPR) repeat protein